VHTADSMTTPKKLLIRYYESENNEDEGHLILDGTLFNEEEVLVLDLMKHRGSFCPTGYRDIVDAEVAMGSYMAHKYAKNDGWISGDPLSEEKEVEESDEEVKEFLRSRRSRREAEYAWVISTGCIEPFDSDAQGLVLEFIDHLVALAKPPTPDGHENSDDREARAYLKSKPDLERQVLALEEKTKRFRCTVPSPKKRTPSKAEQKETKRRKLAEEVTRLQQQLDAKKKEAKIEEEEVEEEAEEESSL
jgi:hypothetical protein